MINTRITALETIYIATDLVLGGSVYISTVNLIQNPHVHSRSIEGTASYSSKYINHLAAEKLAGIYAEWQMSECSSEKKQKIKIKKLCQDH
jgi:hypothetical protein